jgi:hypothetical protein
MAEQALILHIKEMPDLFYNRHGVGLFTGVLAQMNQRLKKFVDVGHIEISGHDQVPRFPVVGPDTGVEVGEMIVAMGGVAKMPQIKVAHEVISGLKKFDILQFAPILFFEMIELSVNVLENCLYGILFPFAHPVDVWVTRRYMDFESRKSGAILAPVLLLLHEDIHFSQAVELVPIFFMVISKRLK